MTAFVLLVSTSTSTAILVIMVNIILHLCENCDNLAVIFIRLGPIQKEKGVLFYCFSSVQQCAPKKINQVRLGAAVTKDIFSTLPL